MKDFTLKQDEQVICETAVSRSARVVSWISVPCYVVVVYFPLIRWGLLRFLWKLVPEIAMLISCVFGCILSILAFIWICICAVQAPKKNGKLVLTDQRILGQQHNRILAENTSDIVDVRIEQSIWGKLFHFGSLSIITNGQNLTVKDLSQAEQIRQQILLAANIQYY